MIVTDELFESATGKGVYKLSKYMKFLAIPAAAILIAAVLTGFRSADQAVLVKLLLEERVLVMQSACYQEMSLEEAEKKLMSIEDQPLLAQDITAIREAAAGDLDRVEKLEVKSIRHRMSQMGYVSYEAELVWYMKGYEGSYIHEDTYFIVLTESNHTYKLAEFQVLAQ